MYRVTLTCSRLTETEGAAAVADILEEFTHRPWKAGVLRLSGTKEVDETGLALLDEFGDTISACVDYTGRIHLAIESVARV